MRTPRRSRSALAVLGVALVSLALAACGDDDKGTSDKPAGSTPQALSFTLGANGKLTGAPSAKSGPATISFTNQSKGKYDLQLVRVEGNRTAEDVLKVIDSDGPVPIPTWMKGGGGVGTTDPGKTAEVTQLLDGGQYYVFAEPDEGEGKPATAPMKVSGGKGTGTLPPADATITASEYTFKTTGLKSGTQKVAFENIGVELHHAIFIPLKAGATLAQAKQFFATEKGAPPFDESRSGPSTTVLDTGGKLVFDSTLQPGKYALVCFLPDRKGGPPHVAKGMITEVNVT